MRAKYIFIALLLGCFLLLRGEHLYASSPSGFLQELSGPEYYNYTTLRTDIGFRIGRPLYEPIVPIGVEYIHNTGDAVYMVKIGRVHPYILSPLLITGISGQAFFANEFLEIPTIFHIGGQTELFKETYRAKSKLGGEFNFDVQELYAGCMGIFIGYSDLYGGLDFTISHTRAFNRGEYIVGENDFWGIEAETCYVPLGKYEGVDIGGGLSLRILQLAGEIKVHLFHYRSVGNPDRRASSGLLSLNIGMNPTPQWWIILECAVGEKGLEGFKIPTQPAIGSSRGNIGLKIIKDLFSVRFGLQYQAIFGRAEWYPVWDGIDKFKGWYLGITFPIIYKEVL